MYDELVKRLRDDEAWKNCDFDFIYGWMHESADVIEELTALSRRQEVELVELTGELASKPCWIPVTERLPDTMKDKSVYSGWSEEFAPSDDVLCYLESDKRQTVAWYSHTYEEWTTVDENTVYEYGEITHWMPLPGPPKEG